MSLFGGKGNTAGSNSGALKTARYSSGWVQISKFLKSREGLRILDIGPTSAGNINFVTGLGHSIYMANLVEDAARPDYLLPQADDPLKRVYDISRFLHENLAFSGRGFDVVTLWDTADYLPEALVQPTIDRIFEVMEPGGHLLGLFHAKPTGDNTAFVRYHLTATDQLELQRNGQHPILQTYTNRQVEGLFRRFASYKFFLAKDTLREVIVLR